MYVKVMCTNLVEETRGIWCPTDASKLHELYFLRKTTRIVFLIGLLREWCICAACIYCHKIATLSRNVRLHLVEEQNLQSLRSHRQSIVHISTYCNSTATR